MWLCSQLGAREHYAIPRALHQGGRLAGLYTDYWAGPLVRKLGGSRKLGRALQPLRSLAARFHPELEDAPVQSWNWRALVWEARLRRTNAETLKTEMLRSVGANAETLKTEMLKSERRGAAKRGPVVSSSSGRYTGFLEVGRRFAVRVREALKGRRDLGPDTIFFAYDTGALEALEWCQERGIKTVLNQMDPNRVEVELVRAEEAHWPGWQPQSVAVPEEYFRRREQEWALADRVLVNSEFCREALVRQGVPAEKLVVVPLCFEAKSEDRRGKREEGSPKSNVQSPKSGVSRPMSGGQVVGGPLKVLWLGQVILRKGIQYLIEAARRLAGEAVRFDVVGPIGISAEAVKSAPANVVFHGRATRDQAGAWYEQADVFVLPTLSDGFAITQLEAMAHGLPVVATPNCGAVVSDGVDGWIVPARDGPALARALAGYLADRGLLREHRAAAFAKSKQFTVARLAQNLQRLEQELLPR